MKSINDTLGQFRVSLTAKGRSAERDTQGNANPSMNAATKAAGYPIAPTDSHVGSVDRKRSIMIETGANRSREK